MFSDEEFPFENPSDDPYYVAAASGVFDGNSAGPSAGKKNGKIVTKKKPKSKPKKKKLVLAKIKKTGITSSTSSSASSASTISGAISVTRVPEVVVISSSDDEASKEGVSVGFGIV